MLDGIDRISIKSKRQLRCVHAIVSDIIECIACACHYPASAPVHIAKGNGIYGHGLGIIFQGCTAVFRLNAASFISCQCHALFFIVIYRHIIFISLRSFYFTKEIVYTRGKNSFFCSRCSCCKAICVYSNIAARPLIVWQSGILCGGIPARQIHGGNCLVIYSIFYFASISRYSTMESSGNRYAAAHSRIGNGLTMACTSNRIT